MTYFRILLMAWGILAALATGWAEPVIVCHYHYGGEDKTVVTSPTRDPYAETYQPVGTWFLFKVLFQNQPRDLAVVKIQVAGNGDDGPIPVHQTNYSYPAAVANHGPHGFTGLHFVYEPVLNGEFIYWCELAGDKA